MDDKPNSKRRAPTSVHLDPAILQRLRVACARLNIRHGDAFDAALCMWLEKYDNSPTENGIKSEALVSRNSKSQDLSSLLADLEKSNPQLFEVISSGVRALTGPQ